MAKKGVKKKPTAAATGELTFEQSLARVEKIVQQLEEGQLPLAQSLDQYEQGVRYLQHCYQLLERAEQRIELLQRVDQAGQAQVVPFDERATFDGPEGGPAGVRRSSPPGAPPGGSGPESDPASQPEDPNTLF